MFLNMPPHLAQFLLMRGVAITEEYRLWGDAYA